MKAETKEVFKRLFQMPPQNYYDNHYSEDDIEFVYDEIERLNEELDVYDSALDILGQNACIGKINAIEQARRELKK